MKIAVLQYSTTKNIYSYAALIPFVHGNIPSKPLAIDEPSSRAWTYQFQVALSLGLPWQRSDFHMACVHQTAPHSWPALQNNADPE